MSPRRKVPPRPDREQEHRADEEYLVRAFHFLVADFGYVAIGPIPVASPEVEVRGYLNASAGIQVELSGHPIGASFFGGLRRLIGGVPAPYGDQSHWLDLEEIAMVRQPRRLDLLSHHLNPGGWRGTVDSAAQLLEDNPDLLTGKGWISRARVFDAWKKHFRRTFGLKLDADEGSVLDLFRSSFAFLQDLGYVLAYDSSSLSPHEYMIGEELRYVNGPHEIAIRCADFRDGEWLIERDGQQVGDIFPWTTAEIASRAAQLAQELGHRV